VNPVSKLDREEKQILEAFESGKLKRTKGAKALQERHREYADAAIPMSIEPRDRPGRNGVKPGR